MIESIVAQHGEQASFLWSQRGLLVDAANASFQRLIHHDDRLIAHIDGLRLAGEAGYEACEARLGLGEPGAIFVAMLLALEAKNVERIETLVAVAETVPAMRAALDDALAWAPARFLRGTVKRMLEAESTFQRSLAISCCSRHRVDPGPPLNGALVDPDPALRETALRCAGSLGRRDLLPACLASLTDKDPACVFAAARSAVLLGDRDAALATLKGASATYGVYQTAALRTTGRVSSLPEVHQLLRALARDPMHKRVLVQGIGAAGDPSYVPWLIMQASDSAIARICGESLCSITGVDLVAAQLDAKAPKDLNSGPSDDPYSADVAMDADEDLSWPDPSKIVRWWESNRARFREGERYFVGETPSVAHCLNLLRTGLQRQRAAAAEHLSLLRPGTPIFDTAAPTWRQKRWLDEIR